MKICPKCKAELDDNARFCLSCMTSLDKKEQIQPPVPKRRWVLVLLLVLVLGGLAFLCGTQLRGKETAQAQESTAPADTGSDWTQEGSSGAEITEEPNYGESTEETYPPGTTTPTQGSTAPSREPTETTIPTTPTTAPTQGTTPTTAPTQGTTSTTSPDKNEEKPTVQIRYFTWEYEGVTYVFQGGTRDGYLSPYPNLIKPESLVLVDVQGTSANNYYNVPSWVDNIPVMGIAAGAFQRVSNADRIGLGFYIARVEANAFGSNMLTAIYISGPETYIHPANYANFSGSMTIYSDDTSARNGAEGELWSRLAAEFGWGYEEID